MIYIINIQYIYKITEPRVIQILNFNLGVIFRNNAMNFTFKVYDSEMCASIKNKYGI